MDRLNEIFGLVYPLRMLRDYQAIDNLLREVDIENTEMLYLIGWLLITAPCKDQLPYREEFYKLARARCVELKGEEDTEKALVGLE